MVDRMKALGTIRLHCTVVRIMEMLGYVHSTQSCYIHVLCFLEYESNVHRKPSFTVTTWEHWTAPHNPLWKSQNLLYGIQYTDTIDKHSWYCNRISQNNVEGLLIIESLAYSLKYYTSKWLHSIFKYIIWSSIGAHGHVK